MSEDEAVNVCIIHTPAHEGKNLDKANASNGLWEFDNGAVNVLQHTANGANYHGKANNN
jgi:hypothetical protein